MPRHRTGTRRRGYGDVARIPDKFDGLARIVPRVPLANNGRHAIYGMGTAHGGYWPCDGEQCRWCFECLGLTVADVRKILKPYTHHKQGAMSPTNSVRPSFGTIPYLKGR